MADTCYNTLKIKGSKEYMKEFFDVLNSNENKEFNLDKFVPIPDELYGIESPNLFEPVCRKTVITEEGKKKRLSVDKAGRTKSEFKLFISELEQKYGYNNADDWCLENWGNYFDVENQLEHESNSENQYIVFYQTPWSSTIEFVDNLYKRFPHLSFVLSYHATSVDEVGSYFRNSTRDVFIQKPYIQLQFLIDKKTGKSIFIVDEENEEFEENGNQEFYSIDIIGYDWKSILEKRGFTSRTVVNWDDLIDCFNF